MALHPLAARALALDAAARNHKRQAQMHRKRARELREKQAEVERQCAARGITVKYVTKGEGDIHGRDDRSTQAT